jgi:hypothetical protein
VDTTVDTSHRVILTAEDADAACTCSGISVGNISISTLITDPIDLSCITEVSGDIVIDNSATVSVDLSGVTNISGDVEVNDNDNLTQVDLSSTTTIGGQIRAIDNNSFANFDLHSLETLGEAFTCEDVPLANLNMASLESIEIEFVAVNCNLENMDLSSLQRAGLFYIADNSMAVLDMPSLTTVESGYLNLIENDHLTELHLPLLSYVHNDFNLKDSPDLAVLDLASLESIGDLIELKRLHALNSIELPALETANRLSINNNSGITSFSAPELDSVGDFTLQNNSTLSSVNVESMTCADSYTVEGNALSEDDYITLLTHLLGC